MCIEKAMLILLSGYDIMLMQMTQDDVEVKE